MKKLKLLISITMLSLSCGSYAAVLDRCGDDVRIMLLAREAHRAHFKVLEVVKDRLTVTVDRMQQCAVAGDNACVASHYAQIAGIAEEVVAKIPAAHHPRVVVRGNGGIIFDSLAPMDTVGDCGIPGNSGACWLLNQVSNFSEAPLAAHLALGHKCGVGIEDAAYMHATRTYQDVFALHLIRDTQTSLGGENLIELFEDAPARRLEAN